MALSDDQYQRISRLGKELEMDEDLWAGLNDEHPWHQTE